MILAVILISACSPQMISAWMAPTDSPSPEPPTPTLPTSTPYPTRIFTYPDTPTPEPFPTRRPSWTPAPTTAATNSNVLGIFGFPPDVDPLTGLKAKDENNLKRRPVMVKISNFPSDARPQAGLSSADIVFEYYIGEFMNRFLAVFFGKNVLQAGPIRSGRFVDAQLVEMYNGLLVYGSADERVDVALEEILGDRAISHLEIGCPVICGEDTHTHSVFANTEKISQYAQKNGDMEIHPDLRGMVFDPNPPQGDDLALEVAVQYVKFYRGEWIYDPENHVYLRWIDDDSMKIPPIMVPLKDRLTDEQLAFENLVILFATYIEYNPTLHDIEIWKNNTGKRALFFRDGVMTEGIWRTVAEDKPIQFFSRWGIPYTLKPGKTWIVLVGDSSKFEQPGPGKWELRFDLP